MVDGLWVFGGTERVTGNSFLVEVDSRDAQTLVPIIIRFIRPGTTILTFDNNSNVFPFQGVSYTMIWRAYSTLQ